MLYLSEITFNQRLNGLINLCFEMRNDFIPPSVYGQIKDMNDNDEISEEDEKFFLEQIKTLGFKLSGTRTFENIPSDKKACLLLTDNDRLRRSIMSSASQNDFIVVFNPELIERKDCKNLFAFIMSETEKSRFPFPELIENKYIDVNLEVGLINDYILSLKSSS